MIKQFYFQEFDLACYLLALSLNVKQFYLNYRLSPTMCNMLGQREPRSYDNEETRCFPQRSPLLELHHHIV